MHTKLSAKRRVYRIVMRAIMKAATVLTIALMLFLIIYVIYKGVGNISFELKTENKKTALTVINTGKGIPEKELPFVFERFYKVDKSRSASKNSTGLGLYIVKTIITAHGGTVAVSSKENEFTAFKVTLP